SITASASTFCYGSTVTLTSDSTSGNQWSTGETSQTITVGSVGDYTLTVTNSGGCPSKQTIHLTQQGIAPAAPSASNSGPVCENSSIDLTASGLAPGGQAGSFDGGSQEILVTQDIPEYDFTIEMWVKTTNGDCGIFSVTDGSHYSAVDRQIYLSGGQ